MKLRLHGGGLAGRASSRLAPNGWRPGRGSLAGVELAIHRSVSQHGFHVFACFGEGDGFHKFGGFLVLVPGDPLVHAGLAGVVGSQGLFPFATPLIEQVAQVRSAERQVDGGLEQGSVAETLDPGAAGQGAAGGRLDLDQAIGVFGGERLRIEFGLLPDDGGDHVGIQALLFGAAHEVLLIGQGEQQLPECGRRILESER